jgi:dTDP-4-dehydrorhamnose reductase
VSGATLLTGGSGLLGSALLRIDPALVAPRHAEMEICDRRAVRAFFETHRPAVVIHAAAVVGAGVCEGQPQRCLDVNVGGTCNLVLAARAVSARLVYLSTDYVFDGTTGHYRETDPVSPINLYGRSKAAGEMVVMDLADSLVIRTSFCASDAWKYDGAFTDQYSSRDRVERIAPQILEAATSSLRGVLHIGGERRSLYDLARTIDASVKQLSIAATGLPLPRDVSLDCTRWQQHRNP